MKSILLTILMLTAVTSFGQEWTKVEVDSLLTMTLPKDYAVSDTVGERKITANINGSYVSVYIFSESARVDNEEQLNKYYERERSGIIAQNNGTLLESELFQKRALRAIRFSFEAQYDGKMEIRHILLVFIHDRSYRISFIEPKSKPNDPAKNKFFSSIEFQSSLTINEQFTKAKNLERSKKEEGNPSVWGTIKDLITTLFKIGFLVIIGIGVYKVFKFFKKQRLNGLIQKYGEEKANMILTNVVAVGMTKEMVSEIWGMPYNPKTVTNKNGITETCMYQKYETKNGNVKFRKYVTYLNGEVKEFGDM